MNSVNTLLNLWLYCQTDLNKTLRWKRYVMHKEGESKHFRRGMRRQSVSEHTLSKSLVFVAILPSLKKILGQSVNFELLFACIICHDLGEGLLGARFDIPYIHKDGHSDVEEYHLFMHFLEQNKIDDATYDYLEKAFLLQFILTSYPAFPNGSRRLMEQMLSVDIIENTAILFQIIEKWEYCFYALEHKNKHPKIWEDVAVEQKKNIRSWIRKYPKNLHDPLIELFS